MLTRYDGARVRTTLSAALIAGVAVVGLVGCSSGSSKKALVTVTATPTPSDTPTATTTDTTGATSSSALATTTPSKTVKATPTKSLPAPTLDTCDNVLPIPSVDHAIGHTVVGRTQFIVNVPDPTIGQIARIDCQYGLPALPKTKTPATPGTTATPATTTAVAPIEASVSQYATAAQAAARITATSNYWRGHSAVPHTVKVGSVNGTVLTGYGAPLLIVASKRVTVAVNITASYVPPAKLTAALSGIAAAALHGARA